MMKKRFEKLLILLMLTVLISSLLAFSISAAFITTTQTGYDSADDVDYYKSGSYIANWGARGEVATFLSSYAENFYTGSYVYDTLSELSGGTSTSNAYNSQLYKQLQSLMKSKHKDETSYQETRYLYKYTDCVSNNTSKISSFYSGKVLSGTWDSGATWNREHTWPNSKGLDGNDENDIMMLRPTSVSENSSRGNTAYGESSGYYDPGESTRGDVARICLYVYVRWGNTGKMWGKSGVMESLDVLLRWMEEDPVDTWEMGRNDAVQSITGTRNVFVDYPEYAWLLFGEEIPDDLQSPSGEGTNSCDHVTEIVGAVAASCTENGYTGDTVCTVCKVTVKKGSVIIASHSYSDFTVTTKPGCTEAGEKSRECSVCHDVDTEEISATGHSFEDWSTVKATSCTEDGEEKRECENCDYSETKTVKATGHSLEYFDGREPTDDLAGFEAYEACTVCEYTTYKEIPPIIDIDGFIAAVNAIDKDAYAIVLYEQIEAARVEYRTLRDDEKALVQEQIEELNTAIEVYNAMIAGKNESQLDILKSIIAPATVYFTFLSLFIFLIEKCFKS